MSNCLGEINEQTIKTWKKDEVPSIISELLETKQHDAIIVISNYFNENKESEKKEDISLFKYTLKLLLSEYTKEIKIDCSDKDVEKLFKLHNRSIHFVKTFVETVEGKWKEQKKEFEKNTPKKVANGIEAVREFVPNYLQIINQIGDQIFHIYDHQKLSKVLDLSYQNWRRALVKCAVDILYSYEEYLFKAKEESDVTKIAKIAADRVLEYSPKKEKDLNTDQCYKELLKTLILAKGKGLKATLFEGNCVKAMFCFNKKKKLKIDDIFAKAPVYFSGMEYRRVTKQLWFIPGKWKFTKLKYGCRRKFNCIEVETLCQNVSSFSCSCINYCLDEDVTCDYPWQINIDDEKSFLRLCKKYSLCVTNSIKEEIDLLKDHFDRMLQNIEEKAEITEGKVDMVKDEIQANAERVIKEVNENVNDAIQANAEGVIKEVIENANVVELHSKDTNNGKKSEEFQTCSSSDLVKAEVSTQEENIRGYSCQNSFATDGDKQELNSNNYDEYQSQTNGSGIVDLNLDEMKKYNKILMSPLKDFRLGFGDLKKILDNGDYVLKIAAFINIEDEDRKTIIFTDHGGGNHALCFLEYLKWFQPNLTIELFQKCLHKHHCIEAENMLIKYNSKYNSKIMFQTVSHKDVMDLSFKLVPPTELSEAIWKDLAADLGICSTDVSKIENMGRRPANFSRTEKLFKIISMRNPRFTIKMFLKALEELKLYDALELMHKKIIEKIACI